MPSLAVVRYSLVFAIVAAVWAPATLNGMVWDDYYEVDFGSEPSRLLYEGRGFRWNEGDGSTTWSWTTQPQVDLELPLDTDGVRRLAIRWMSTVDNQVKVLVNGSLVGELLVPGGWKWQDAAVYVPQEVWRSGAIQQVTFQFAHQQDGVFVAFDRLSVSPVTP